MKIPITNSKLFAIVDDEDYEIVCNHSWSYGMGGVISGASGRLIMARLIMKPRSDQDVDHINGDKLDNRKHNLRICSHQENSWNSRHPRGPSGFVGVTFHKPTGKWRADISKDYKTIYIGLFETPELAALARDEKARELHGEFATLNYPT